MDLKDISGRLLAGALTVLLTVPLAIAVHHHEAEHDGGVPHLEVPHGGHESPAPELYDRITSTGPEGPTAQQASQAPAFHDGFVVRVVAISPEHPDHPARPPPAPHPARAPPLGF
jgi:hypothetical protein